MEEDDYSSKKERKLEGGRRSESDPGNLENPVVTTTCTPLQSTYSFLLLGRLV